MAKKEKKLKPHAILTRECAHCGLQYKITVQQFDANTKSDISYREDSCISCIQKFENYYGEIRRKMLIKQNIEEHKFEKKLLKKTAKHRRIKAKKWPLKRKSPR